MHDHDQDAATVREWTDILARIRIGKVRIAGKNVTGATVKAVAGRMASYADGDGTRVRPGLARVAVDLELDHGTVKRAVGWLVRVGLLRLVRAGARPGHADEYRLAIPATLLETCEVWSPSQHALEVQRVREATRGAYRRGPRDPDPDPLRVPQGPADPDDLRVPPVPADGHLLVPQAPAGEGTETGPAGATGTSKSGPAGATGTDLLVPQAPATHHDLDTTTTHHSRRDLRTDLTVPRAREEPDQDQISEVGGEPPGHCPAHGRAFAAGTRPDGRPACPLCRVAEDRAAGRRRSGPVDPRGIAPVIPIHRETA